MGNELWLSAVVAVTGAVLVVMITLVLRSLRSDSPTAGPGSGLAAAFPSASIARGIGRLFGPLGTPQRTRSVEGSFTLAVERIAAVDPYEAPRRVGIALLEVGLDHRTDDSRGRRPR